MFSIAILERLQFVNKELDDLTIEIIEKREEDTLFYIKMKNIFTELLELVILLENHATVCSWQFKTLRIFAQETNSEIKVEMSNDIKERYLRAMSSVEQYSAQEEFIKLKQRIIECCELLFKHS